MKTLLNTLLSVLLLAIFNLQSPISDANAASTYISDGTTSGWVSRIEFHDATLAITNLPNGERLGIVGASNITLHTTNSVTTFTTNQFDVFTTNNLTVFTTNSLTTFTTNQFDLFFTNNVTINTTNALTTFTTNMFDVFTTNNLTVFTTNSLTTFTTNQFDVFTTNNLTVFTTNSLTTFTTNQFDLFFTNNVTINTTNSLTTFTTNQFDVFTTNNVTVNTTNNVTVNTTNNLEVLLGAAITNLTAGSNVTVTNLGAGVWQIAATGGGSAPPTAGFTAYPTNGGAPMEVVFTNTTTGYATNYYWSFGDGGSTNTTYNSPLIYTYVAEGTNTVTLIATGDGSSTNAQTNLIWVAGASAALLFTNTDQVAIATYATNFFPTGAWTVECWVMSYGGSSAYSVIMGTRSQYTGGYELFLKDDNTFYFEERTSGGPVSYVGTNSVTTGVWVHVAVTFDGASTKRLWVNGVIDQELSNNYTMMDSGYPFRLCQHPDGDPQAKFGIDEVRVSSACLYTATFTPSRVLSTNASTIALWHFDEGAGDTVQDASTNAFNLSLTNQTWITR